MDYLTRHHPKSQRLTLRLNKAGQPVVTVPRFMPRWLVDRFVKANTDWITAHQQKLQKNKDQFLSASAITIFGQTYQQIIQPTTGASKVTISQKKLLVALHQSPAKKTKLDEVLEKFLKNTASHYLVPRVHQLAKKMKVDFTKITLRAQTTRWGSCSSRGSLNFNWKLVHFPPAIIDYVIIHELAHRKHLDHSANFWQYVKQFDPEYLLHRGWLKRKGIGVV